MAVYTETIQLDTKPMVESLDRARRAGESFGQWQARIRKDSPKKSLQDTATAVVGVGSSSSVAAVAVGTLAKATATLTKEEKALHREALKQAKKNAKDDAGNVDTFLKIAAGAGVAAMGVATFVAGSVAGLAKFALETTAAKQAAVGLWTALGEGKITGEEVDDMLDDMRKSLGIAKDTLAPLTEGFLRMGITGKKELEKLTTAAISAEATIVGGGAAFEALFTKVNAAGRVDGGKIVLPLKKLEAQLVGLGLTSEDMAKQLGMPLKTFQEQIGKSGVDAKKFGAAMQDAIIKKGKGPLEIMANSFDNITKDLKGTFGDLFEDFGKDIAPFLKEVKSLFGIIDSKANPSGQALKAGIGVFFKQVFAGAALAVPVVKHFLLDVVIWGLKAYIGLKPMLKWFDDLRKNETFMRTLGVIFDGVKSALIGSAIATGIAVAAIGGLIAAFGLIGGAVFGVVQSLISVGVTIVSTLTGWVASAISFGSSFVDGLISGIVGGAGKLVASVKGLADSAAGSFKSALGIASPSKVMAGYGLNVAEGAAQGIDQGLPSIEAATKDMSTTVVKSAPAPSDTASQSPAASTQSGGGNSIVVNVQIDGAGKTALEMTEEMFVQVFNRMALGAGV